MTFEGGLGLRGVRPRGIALVAGGLAACAGGLAACTGAPDSSDTAPPPVDPATFDDNCGEILPFAPGTSWQWRGSDGTENNWWTDALVAEAPEDLDGIPVATVGLSVRQDDGEGHPLESGAWNQTISVRCDQGNIWVLGLDACAADGSAARTVRYDPPYELWSDVGYTSGAGWDIASQSTEQWTNTPDECDVASDAPVTGVDYAQPVRIGAEKRVLTGFGYVLGRELTVDNAAIAVFAPGYPLLRTTAFPTYTDAPCCALTLSAFESGAGP